jgi:hypothetical protein
VVHMFNEEVFPFFFCIQNIKGAGYANYDQLALKCIFGG